MWLILTRPQLSTEDSNSSAEIITTNGDDHEGPSKKRRKLGKKPVIERPPAIANLVISGDGRHAVATTGEDKSVHVFAISTEGQIQHLSQR